MDFDKYPLAQDFKTNQTICWDAFVSPFQDAGARSEMSRCFPSGIPKKSYPARWAPASYKWRFNPYKWPKIHEQLGL